MLPTAYRLLLTAWFSNFTLLCNPVPSCLRGCIAYNL